MNNCTLPLIVFFLWICNSNQKTNDSENSNSYREKEWLSYTGKVNAPKIVLISGDEEYRSEEALPQLAKILSAHHGFNCVVLFAQDPVEPGIVDPNYSNNIPGLDQLQSADLMIIFTRFRALPDEQMKHIDNYLKSGRPVIGMRTATHAFQFEDIDFESNYRHYGNSYDREGVWKDGFGRLVLGEKWISHHGWHGNQSTKGIATEDAEGHPILNGIADGDIWGPSDVYEVRLPLSGDSKPIIMGQVIERKGAFNENDPLLGMRQTDNRLPEKVIRKNKQGQEIKIDQNDPMMPIVWTKTYKLPNGKTGKAFTSTIGASTDLLSEGTRRMYVNASYWLLELEVPENAKVDFVGTYQPTRFKFYEDSYWEDRNLKIRSLE